MTTSTTKASAVPNATTTRQTGIRVIYIAPKTGASGVGDYADDFLRGIEPHVAEVRQIRHDGPGKESIRDVLRVRRELREIIAENPHGRTIVHAEQSGGAITPFWAPAGLRGVAVTATVHDPPFSVWWPFRTRGLARIRILMHGLHQTMFGVMNRIERRVNRSRTLFALTVLGAERLAERMRESTVIVTEHVVPERPELRPVAERPLAVGLFGYVYRGKGFETLSALRAALDDDIAIRVAGRGTEKLPHIDGVEVLGEVNGVAEDEFFDSVRALLVPYVGREQYGVEVIVATGTVSRALAYQTPVIALATGALTDDTPGVAVVRGGAWELGSRASALVRDDAAMSAMQDATRVPRQRDSAENIAHRFLDVWEALL